MFGCLTVPMLLTAVVGSFWWLWAPWILIGILGCFVLFTWIGTLQIKASFKPELSLPANEMLQRHAGYFYFPFAAREFSSLSSGIQLSAAFVSIVHGYQYSWWIIAVGIVCYVIFGPIAMKMNPSHFLNDEGSKLAFDEVVEYIAEQRKADREQRLSGKREIEGSGKTSAPDDAERPLSKEGRTSSDNPIDALVDSMHALLMNPFTATGRDANVIFKAAMVNEKAMGYLFGFHDAFLQGTLGVTDDTAKVGQAIMQRCYQKLFGFESGNALFQKSLDSQEDEEFTEGRMKGGSDFMECTTEGKLPVGLLALIALDL